MHTNRWHTSLIDIQCTWLLVVYWASVVDQNKCWDNTYQTFTMVGSALRCKLIVMNLVTCFQEQMQVPLNKELEHCTTTLQSSTKRTIQVVWLYSVQLYNCLLFKLPKKSDFVRINAVVLRCKSDLPVHTFVNLVKLCFNI